MILGIEIAMFVMGIIAIVKGKLTLAKGKVVYGTPARLIGAIGLLPLPLAFLAIIVFAVIVAASDPNFNERAFEQQYRWTAVGIEVGCVLLCLVLFYAIGLRYAESPEADEAPRRRRRRDEDEDEDEEDDFEEEVAPSRRDEERHERAVRPKPAPLPAASPAIPTTIACSSCSATLRVTPAIAGKKVRCPKCQTILVAPPLPMSSDAITERPKRTEKND
jgi:predicted Zn finger-like uncharacterized protein